MLFEEAEAETSEKEPSVQTKWMACIQKQSELTSKCAGTFADSRRFSLRSRSHSPFEDAQAGVSARAS